MSDHENNKSSEGQGGWVKRLLPLALLAAVALLIFSQGWHKYLTFQELAENRDHLKSFIDKNLIVAIAAYMGIYIIVISLSLPGGVLLTLSGGFLFGWMIGGAATIVAATIGATLIFLIAKTSLGEPLAARAGPWLEKLREGFQDNALNYLLFLRLVPAFPFWLINLAPALLGVTLKTYILGTFFGIMPGTLAFSYVGVGLDSIIEAQQGSYQACLATQSETQVECALTLDVSALVTPELLIAFGALGVVALIPVAIKKLKLRKA